MRTLQNDMRKRLGILAAFFLVIASSGCALAPQSGSNAFGPGGSPSTKQQAQPTATILFCNNSTAGCSGTSTFSASSLRDLSIVVNWNNLPSGNHAQTVNVFHPGGGLYQSFRTSFLTNKASSGSQTTSDALPVAGTWIVQRSMLGAWKVEVRLDGQLVARQNVTLTR